MNFRCPSRLMMYFLFDLIISYQIQIILLVDLSLLYYIFLAGSILCSIFFLCFMMFLGHFLQNLLYIYIYIYIKNVVCTNFVKVQQYKQNNRKICETNFFIKINNCRDTIFVVILFYKRFFPFDSFTLITIRKTMMKTFFFYFEDQQGHKWLVLK